MPTLSFHAPTIVGRKIRAAAGRQKVPVSRFLREAAEHAAITEPLSGLGRELERLALEGLALVSLEHVRARAAAAGLDRMTARQITAEIKASRQSRRR